MITITAIRNDADLDAAFARIWDLMDAEPGTPEGDELDVFARLVERYEDRQEPLARRATS